MLSPHPSAALEYWFFKVNAGPTALLVDWIVKRRVSEHWLRVSIHSPHGREVIFEKQDVLMPGGATFLTDRRTEGRLGDISWELDIEPGPCWIAPDIFPAQLLKMPDLSIASAPLAVFTGWIRHADHSVELNRSPGAVSHYWGRQLAAEWWWISASQFDRPGIAVECSVLRTALWGTSIRMPLAYLYLREGDREQMVMALPGMARVSGGPEDFEIRIGRPGKSPITLIGSGRDYGDLGDGVINTLVGDLEIREGNRLVGRAIGTAGLERRELDTHT